MSPAVLPAVYRADPRRVMILAGARRTEAGAALLDAAETLRDQARAELENNPNVSDRGREDFRFYLGVVEGLTRLLNLEAKSLSLLPKT